MGNIVVTPGTAVLNDFESYLFRRAFLNPNLRQDKQITDLIQVQCRDEVQSLLESAESQDQLIAGIKIIWRKLKVTKKTLRRPGRPTVKDMVNAEIEGWYKGRGVDILEKAIDGQLIRHVCSRLGKTNLKQQAKSTITKYVRLWRLQRTPPWEREIADWKFLFNHDAKLTQKDVTTIRHLCILFPQRLSMKRAEERITAALNAR